MPRSPRCRQPAGVAHLPSYAKQAAAIVAAEREELKALQPPDADRAKAGELGAAMDEVAKAAEGLIAVAGDGNAQDIEAYVSRNRGRRREGEAAREGARHDGLREAMRRPALALAVAALAVALAGCGSSSGASSVQQRRARCRRRSGSSPPTTSATAAKVEVLALPKPTTHGGARDAARPLIEIFAKEHKDLQSLVPVASEQASVDTVVEAAGLQVTLARGLQEVAKTGDTTAINAYTAANAAKVQQAQRVAQQYGLKVCGNPR